MNLSWSVVFSVLIGFLGIDILIIMHELGHFLAARIFHIYVEKIQIGLGPAAFKKLGENGTEYCLGIVPYGAFCKMDTTSLETSHPLKKILIYLAGPVFNIVFAIICYTLYLCFFNTSFFHAVNTATLQCINEMGMFISAIGKMITGQQKLSETLSGLFNTSRAIGEFTRAGFASGFRLGLESAIWISASVSVSLAFANLLPIPALDGGFILISLLELIFHKKISEKFQVILQITGLIILLVVLPVVRYFF